MKATGWACDVCKTFHTSTDDRTPPVGWMVVTTIVDSKVTVNAGVNTAFHICSNKCLRDLGTARWKAEREGGEAYEPPEAPAAPEPEPTSNGVTSSGKKRNERGSNERRTQPGNVKSPLGSGRSGMRISGSTTASTTARTDRRLLRP